MTSNNEVNHNLSTQQRHNIRFIMASTDEDDDYDDDNEEQRGRQEQQQQSSSSNSIITTTLRPIPIPRITRRRRRLPPTPSLQENSNNNNSSILSSLRGWMFYNPVASTTPDDDDDDDEEYEDEEDDVVGNEDNRNRRRRNDENDIELNNISSNKKREDNEDEKMEDIDTTISNDNPDVKMLNVIILDYMNQKFNVSVPAEGTIHDLKMYGSMIHKVPIPSQRLIYRGQLLVDEQTLTSTNINTDQCIIHLFPKPRVVVIDNNNNNNTTSDIGSNNDDDTNNNGGARIPTIIMNRDEHEGRSQILVLSSSDFIESQNNVKLFSFMLLIISSIELLNLFAIAMGVPQSQSQQAAQAQQQAAQNHHNAAATSSTNNTLLPWTTNNVDDDVTSFFPNLNNTNHTSEYNNWSEYDYYNYNDTIISNSSYLPASTIVPSVYNDVYNDDVYMDAYEVDDIVLDLEHEKEDNWEHQHGGYQKVDPAIIKLYQSWNILSYIDLFVSLLGIYVALLGIRASNENHLKIAQYYLYGTVITAIGWSIYNFLLAYEVDEIIFHEQHDVTNNNNTLLSNDTTTTTTNNMENDDYYVNHNEYNQYNPYNVILHSQHEVVYNALQVLILPSMVWLLCIYRAYIFSFLLEEAEIEALERIRDEYNINDIHNNEVEMIRSNINHNNNRSPPITTATTTNVANSSATITPVGTMV